MVANTAFRAAKLTLAAFSMTVLAACGGAESKSTSDPSATANTAPGKKDNAPLHAHAGVLANDMVIGSADAPITIVEYASVTCPHCATFHQTILPEIKEKYVENGQVRFVFREFPTAPVRFALIGSVMARCAADKGGPDAYFAVLGALFKDQRGWIYGQDPKAELLKIASQAGMDEAAFDTCLQRQELVDLINENTRIASEDFKINGTPSFLLNGEKLNANSVEAFEKAIDAALAKETSGEG
ncbi:MAG: DsbA family protein [Pseudomonadota bacterium]